jgi:glycosyltransferase involved in cell wall biosynthesis
MYKSKQVDIILPVYNGEKYLIEQIQSILKQTYPSWRLLIRDDGSWDNTVSIIREYSKNYNQKIILIEDDKGNLGVTNNVFEILTYVESDYVMFCDQDDVWKENKVENLLKYIMKAEIKYPDTPILVHSDASVVDKNLQIINASFTNMANFNRSNSNLSNLLQFNIVQGATVVFNKRLYEKMERLFCIQVSKKTYHDWWCALIAAAFGKIFFYDQSFILYRQHGKNLVGVGYFKQKKLKELLKDIGGEIRVTNYCKVNRLMCRKFLDYYHTELSVNQLKIIEHFYNRPNDLFEFIKLGLFLDYRLKEIVLMFLFGIE